MTTTPQTPTYLKEHNETIDRPPGPLGGFWSMYYINRPRVFKIMIGHLGFGAEGYIAKLYKKAKVTFPPGEEFPAIDLETTTGKRINTADFKGKKHFVLMAGAMTWPPYRRQVPPFEQLKEKYEGRDVEVLHLYVREPHPDETIFTDYHEHRTYEQKMQYARDLVEQKSITADVLVDGIDEQIHHDLGDLPNLVYVVGKDGRVHYKATWSDAAQIDKALAELVTADDPANPVQPSISTKKADWRIREIKASGWKRFLPVPW